MGNKQCKKQMPVKEHLRFLVKYHLQKEESQETIILNILKDVAIVLHSLSYDESWSLLTELLEESKSTEINNQLNKVLFKNV